MFTKFAQALIDAGFSLIGVADPEEIEIIQFSTVAEAHAYATEIEEANVVFTDAQGRSFAVVISVIPALGDDDVVDYQTKKVHTALVDEIFNACLEENDE